MFATTNMIIRHEDGDITRFDVTKVDEVFFNDYAIDPSALDTAATPLNFNILSDSTAEVISGDYESLKSVDIPEKVYIGGKVYTVASIGNKAFYNCSNMTSVNIPEGVITISSMAFFRSGLRTITIPKSVTSIGGLAFNECKNLTPGLLIYNNGTKCNGWIGDISYCNNIKIPTGVTEIDDQAFYKISYLKSMTIPESVTTIGNSAFAGCIELDLVIDNSKKNVTIGENTFDYVKSVTFRHDLEWYDPSIPDSYNTLFKFEITSDSTAKVTSYLGRDLDIDSIAIPAKVRINDVTYNVNTIGERSFTSSIMLKTIVIPEGITTIEEDAFIQCKNVVNADLPESLVYIGEDAFMDCRALTGAKIPKNVEFIGKYAFSCNIAGSPFSTYIVDPENKYYSSVEGVLYNKDTTIMVDMPAAFTGEFVLPASVDSIGNHELNNIWAMTYITVPEENKSFSSVDGALYNKEKTKMIVVPADIKGKVSIPEGVTEIPNSIFYNRKGVTDITIPDGVTTIGDYAFAGVTCTRIKLPETVTTIGKSAFSACERLTTLNIPNGVTRIEEYTFNRCSKLTNFILPESVTYIGKDAFYFATIDLKIDNSKSNVELGRDALSQCRSVTWLKD